MSRAKLDGSEVVHGHQPCRPEIEIPGTFARQKPDIRC